MSQETLVPNRWIGLDGHKHYLVAGGVDAQLTHVLGPQRVQLSRLDSWARKTLTPLDSVALEMSTNSFELYDEISPYVHSMILVHPPHVGLIARAQVKAGSLNPTTRNPPSPSPVFTPSACSLLSGCRPRRCATTGPWFLNAPRWCASLLRPRTAFTPSSTET